MINYDRTRRKQANGLQRTGCTGDSAFNGGSIFIHL